MARGDGYSIIKRKRGGHELANFEVRVQVPREWRTTVGRLDILKSTGTGDRRLAAQRAPGIVAALYADWAHQAGAASVGGDPSAIAVAVGFDGMLHEMEDRRKTWSEDDTQYEERLSARQSTLRRMARRLQDGELSQWEGVADRLIEERNLPIKRGSDEYRGFVQTLAEATVAAVDVFTRRAAGELDASPRAEVVREVKARQAATAPLGETILSLFELYSDEALAKQRKRLDTVNQDRKVIERFATFVGRNRNIRTITPSEVAEYRDTLRDLPPKWMSKRELRGLEMRAAAAKARSLGMPRMAFTNINKHLSTISPLFTWLRRQPKWAGLGNPVDGLFYDGVKGKNPLPPFTTAALNQILSSPLFTGFEADGREHLPGEVHADDWRYWIPLIALFTGARIGEIAQLRLCDVARERGVWFFHIRHDDDQGLSTKSRETRVAALHPMLERLGFLDFHARQRKVAGEAEDAALFPEIERNGRGQVSGRPSRWWRDYLEDIGVKAGADGQGAHSFRHTLADRLRSEAELLDNQIAVCLGHSVKTTTSGYGTLSQGTVNMLKGYMEAVRFDGVEFDHLMPSDHEDQESPRATRRH